MYNFLLLNYEDLTEKEFNQLSFISKEKIVNAFNDEKPSIFDFIELNAIDRKFFYAFREENILTFLSLRDWSTFLFTNNDFKSSLENHFPSSIHLENSKQIFDNICLLFDFLQYKKANPKEHKKRILEHDINVFDVYLKHFKNHLCFFSNKKIFCHQYYQKAKNYYLKFFKIYEKNENFTDYFLNLKLIKNGIGINIKYVNDEDIFSQTKNIITQNLHKDYPYISKTCIIATIIKTIYSHHNLENHHQDIQKFKKNILNIENFDYNKFFSINIKTNELRTFLNLCSDDFEFMNRFISTLKTPKEIIKNFICEMLFNRDEPKIINNILYSFFSKNKEYSQYQVESFIKEIHQQMIQKSNNSNQSFIDEQIKI